MLSAIYSMARHCLREGILTRPHHVIGECSLTPTLGTQDMRKPMHWTSYPMMSTLLGFVFMCIGMEPMEN